MCVRVGLMGGAKVYFSKECKVQLTYKERRDIY